MLLSPVTPSPAPTPDRHRHRAVRTVRHVLLWVVVVLLAMGSATATVSAAGAQETTPSTATASTPATVPATVPATDVTTPVPDDVDVTPNMIPQPNSGRAPRDAGERGGWMQEVLFFAVCGAVLVIGALVWRESRAKRRQQGRLT